MRRNRTQDLDMSTILDLVLGQKKLQDEKKNHNTKTKKIHL
jgi:hypothetical protein